MAKELKLTIKLPEGKKLKKKVRKNFSRYFNIVIKSLLKAKNDILEKKYYSILLILLFAVLIFKVSLTAGIFWLIFLSFLIYDWDSRITASLALLFLISCPILLSLKKDAIAELMAVYTYYFLVITVILQIVEYKRHPEEYSDDEEVFEEEEEKINIDYKKFFSYFKKEKKSGNKLWTFLNILVVVIYFVLSGFENLKKENLYKLSYLIIALIILNICFYLVEVIYKKLKNKKWNFLKK